MHPSMFWLDIYSREMQCSIDARGQLADPCSRRGVVTGKQCVQVLEHARENGVRIASGMITGLLH